MKRTFVGFLLLRDKSGLIIPSNTIDLTCNGISINEDFYIPSGTLIGHTDSILFAKYNPDLIGDNYDKKYRFPEYKNDVFVKYIPEYDDFKHNLSLISKDTYELLEPYRYFRTNVSTDEVSVNNIFLLIDDEVTAKFTEYGIVDIDPHDMFIFDGDESKVYLPYSYIEAYETIYENRKAEFYEDPNNANLDFPEAKIKLNTIIKELFVQLTEESDQLIQDAGLTYGNQVFDNYAYNPPISCVKYNDTFKPIKDALVFLSSDVNCVLKTSEDYIELPEDSTLNINELLLNIYHFNNKKYIKRSEAGSLYEATGLIVHTYIDNKINKYIEFTDNIRELVHTGKLGDEFAIEIYDTEDGRRLVLLSDLYYSQLLNLYNKSDPLVPQHPDDMIIPDDEIVYTVKDHEAFEEDIENDNLTNDLIYRLPYSVYYKKSPYQRLVTVKNDLDDDLYFKFSKVNANINSEFIMQNINIKRSPVTYIRKIKEPEFIYDEGTGNLATKIEYLTNGNKNITLTHTYNDNAEVISTEKTIEYTNDINKYFLTFNLNTTLLANIRVAVEQERNIKFSSNRNFYQWFKTNKILLVRCLIRDKSNNYVGYFDFECDDYSSLQFYKVLTTDNYINRDNALRLVDCVYGISQSDEIEYTSQQFDQFFYLPEEVRFELCFLVKTETKPEDIILDYPLNKHTDLQVPTADGKYYTEAVRFLANKDFSLFIIMNNIISPILELHQNHYLSELQRGILIKGLPVIGKHYLYNYEVFKDFFYVLYIYYIILKSNFDKLENNTSVNINFYNTYGQSNYFKITSNDEINTNINIEIDITLVDTYTTDLDFKIKNFIVDFVEKVNKTSNKIFALSNLAKALEQEFPDIHYIEFKSINGHSLTGVKNQTVIADYPTVDEMTKEQLINYVPEYINIHINKEAYIEGKNNFNVGISINYK